MAVTLDTLELKIQSNSAGASSGIRSLIDSLSSLKGTTDDSLQSLQKLSDTLGSIASSLKNIKFTQSLQTALKNTPLTEMKNQAEDASKALTITGNQVDEFKSKELPAEWFGERTGKDWTQENAEDTRYFDAWLSRIANNQEKYEKIRDTVKGMHVYDSAAQADEVANVKPVLGEVEKVSEAVENMPTLEEALQFSDEASKAEMLQMKLEGVQEQLANALGQDNFDSKKIATYSLQIKTLQEQLAKLERVEREQNKTPSTGSAINYATELSQYETLRMKAEGVGQKLASELGKETPDQSKVAGYASQIQTLEEKMRGLAEAESEVNANKPEVSGFGKLMAQIGKIAKTMAIRSALRGTIKALKEGVTNLYNWSDTVNGHFAQSMDSAASHFTLMKNSLATVAGPILESLIPAFNVLANVINGVCNALAQFFALIGGQSTWTKATLGADKFGKAAGGAGGAAKDLLADWDELNIIQSQGGGGGGSGSNGFSGMFEEMQLPTWMTEWKPLIDAVLAGTLGAILLPKIFDIIKKIMDLFGGSGALNAIDILKRMFKLPDTDFTNVTNDLNNLVDTFNKPLTDTGIDNLLKDLGDDSLDDILKNLSPLTDLFKDNNFLDTINGLLGLASDLGDKFDWTTLIPEIIKLLSQLFDGNDKDVKVKVDDSAYKKFKDKLDKDDLDAEVDVGFNDAQKKKFNKELDDIAEKLKKGNDVHVGFKTNVLEMLGLLATIASIDNKLAQDRTMRIGADFSELTRTSATLDDWAAKDAIKNVSVNVDSGEFYKVANDVDGWCAIDEFKDIEVNIDESNVLNVLNEIEEKCASGASMNVVVTIDSSAFDSLKETIDTWCAEPITKTISIETTLPGTAWNNPTNNYTAPSYVPYRMEDFYEEPDAEELSFVQKLGKGFTNIWQALFGSGEEVNQTNDRVKYTEPIGPAQLSPSVPASEYSDVTSVLLPQILSAVQQVATNVNTVNSTIESKDTSPTIIVNSATGTTSTRNALLNRNAFNNVTGDIHP